MKKLIVSAWFGDITPEEVKKIQEQTKDFENRVAEYQRRPIKDAAQENNNK